MNYSRKDVLIGLVIIALIIIGVVYYNRTKVEEITPTPLPTEITFQKEIEDRFRFNIPDNENVVELKDVTGGNARGLATENEILVDIDDPQKGYIYQGWLEKNGEIKSLGKLQMAKGGWLIEYNGKSDTGSKKIIISLEKVYDKKLEQKILEGTFN